MQRLGLSNTKILALVKMELSRACSPQASSGSSSQRKTWHSALLGVHFKTDGVFIVSCSYKVCS